MSASSVPSGSATLTLTVNDNNETNTPNNIPCVLKLKSKKNVKWDDTAVDNEHMKKKSSKSRY